MKKGLNFMLKKKKVKENNDPNQQTENILKQGMYKK